MNLLLCVITPASPSSPVVLRWLREQHGAATMHDACCCSARRVFAIRGLSVTVDEACSQTGQFTATDVAGDKRWRTMPGGKVFSGCPA